MSATNSANLGGSDVSSATESVLGTYDECRQLIGRGKQLELNSDYPSAKDMYKQALTKYPHSCEANQRYAQLVHRYASKVEDLVLVEQYYRKALESVSNYISLETGMPLSNDESCCDELEAATTAEDKLGLLLCQSEGREVEANNYLKSLGYKYRLSTEILNYQKQSQLINISVGDDNEYGQEYFKVMDDVLPLELLDSLKSGFSPDAKFWSQHHYGTTTTGFFSYVYRLEVAPRNDVEKMIVYLHATLKKQHPDLKDKDIKYAEWWVHTRPHTYGHQLHYDSDDEGRNGLRHPIKSSVMFLDGEVGGPTLFTNQTLKGVLGDKGWLVHPKTNRYCMFDGNVLHGVVPGKGYQTNTNTRRVTFMTAFWEDIQVRNPNKDLAPGSSQPLPTKDTHPHYTWMDDFQTITGVTKRNKDCELMAGSGNDLSMPVKLDKVWVGVDQNTAVPRTTLPHYNLCFQGF